VVATVERQQGIPPRNAASGRPYRRVNFLQLSLAGYESPWWLTFKQAKDRDAQVRRGARGMTIVKWTHTRRGVSEREAAVARAEGRRVERDEHDEHGAYLPQVGVRHHVVFNAEQIDGVEDLSPTARDPTWQPAAQAAAIAAGYEHGPGSAEGGSRACYQPDSDRAQMPDRGRFTTATDWHATLFHELPHSTGHRSRLDRRDLYADTFGSPAYARKSSPPSSPPPCSAWPPASTRPADRGARRLPRALAPGDRQ
jgi:antirestriction protein ArdC